MEEKQPTFEIIYSKEFFSDLKIHKQSGNKQILKKIDTFLERCNINTFSFILPSISLFLSFILHLFVRLAPSFVRSSTIVDPL